MLLCANCCCPKPADPFNANNPICPNCGSELLFLCIYHGTEERRSLFYIGDSTIPQPAMQLCLNPSCPKPADPLNANNLICRHCGSELLLHNRYRVIRLLSDDSGFGNVYEADDHGTRKILKVLKEHYNTNTKAVKLFLQEAAVLSKLNHPGIPKVDGYFQVQLKSSQLHCIVMEKIDGLNLEEWQNKRDNQPVSAEQALIWLKQLAEILDIIHQHSYFHRDIKPPNIMLRPNGQVVLIDFGSTREMTYTYFGKVGGSGKVTKLTSAGYTPPEQENGHAVPQSDFYALGRTMVYLLTGKQPNDTAVYDPYNDELRWRNYARGISPHLADLIDELMAPKAGQRPKNTQEILQRLDNISREFYPTPPAWRPKQKNKWLVGAAGAVLVLIAGLGGVQMYSQSLFNSDFIPLIHSLSFLKTTLTGHSNYVDTVSFSPDGKTLVSGSEDKTIKIWDVTKSKALRTLSDNSSSFYAVAISPDGQTLASGGGDNKIKIWNISSGELIRTLTDHSDAVSAVAISPDGQNLASGSWDKTIKIWNISTGKLLGTLSGHSASVSAVAFSPDGRTLASGSDDYSIKIWDLATGQDLSTLIGHSDLVRSVAFNPDGKTLSSGSWDKTIKIWNLSTGEAIHTLTQYGEVNSVAFSPNGQILASGSRDNVVKIWNLSTREAIRTFTGHSGSVSAVAFSPDGKSLASGSNDNTIKIWRMRK